MSMDMNKLMQQMTEMQAQMQQAHDELAKETVDASAGGGMVTVTANGSGEIQSIKIAVPQMAEWVIDKAIQAHGGAGVSQDTPLTTLWAAARMLRIADGPDEVHEMVIARRELKRFIPG